MRGNAATRSPAISPVCPARSAARPWRNAPAAAAAKGSRPRASSPAMMPGEHIAAPGGRQRRVADRLDHRGSVRGCDDRARTLQERDGSRLLRQEPRRCDSVVTDRFAEQPSVLALVRRHDRRRAAGAQRGGITRERVEPVGVEHQGHRDRRDEVADRCTRRVRRAETRTHRCGAEPPEGCGQVVGYRRERAVGSGRERAHDDLGPSRACCRLHTRDAAPDDPGADAHRCVTHEHRCTGHPAGPADDEQAGRPLVGVRLARHEPGANIALVDDPQDRSLVRDVDADVDNLHRAGTTPPGLEAQPGFVAAKVTVDTARTASPRTCPVDPSTPDGMSTARVRTLLGVPRHPRRGAFQRHRGTRCRTSRRPRGPRDRRRDRRPPASGRRRARGDRRAHPSRAGRARSPARRHRCCPCRRRSPPAGRTCHRAAGAPPRRRPRPARSISTSTGVPASIVRRSASPICSGVRIGFTSPPRCSRARARPPSPSSPCGSATGATHRCHARAAISAARPCNATDGAPLFARTTSTSRNLNFHSPTPIAFITASFAPNRAARLLTGSFCRNAYSRSASLNNRSGSFARRSIANRNRATSTRSVPSPTITTSPRSEEDQIRGRCPPRRRLRRRRWRPGSKTRPSAAREQGLQRREAPDERGRRASDPVRSSRHARQRSAST